MASDDAPPAKSPGTLGAGRIGHHALVADRLSAASVGRGCALGLFGLAWLLLFLVVGIGAGYGSDDPLLAVYAGLLVAGVGVMWRGAARRQTASHALFYVAAVVITLWLGSTYG